MLLQTALVGLWVFGFKPYMPEDYLELLALGGGVPSLTERKSIVVGAKGKRTKGGCDQDMLYICMKLSKNKILKVFFNFTQQKNYKFLKP